MKLSMYEACVPPISRALENLAAVLDKSAAQVDGKKIDQSVFMSARLFPDMFPLAKQVQIASDISKGGAARLAGVEFPAYEDNEATFADLAQRCRKTVEFLKTLQPPQFEGAEDRTVTWKTRTSEKSMQGTPYLFNHVLPNVFFHTTTAYDILRHNGIELGKQDFLGRS